MGLRADAEGGRSAEQWIPEGIPGPPRGCGSPRCRARTGRQPTPPATPRAPGGALAPAPRRAGQCAPGAPAVPGPGRARLAAPSLSPRAPPRDEVLPSAVPRPQPVPALRPGGVRRGARIRPHNPPRRRGATRFEAPSVGAVPSRADHEGRVCAAEHPAGAAAADGRGAAMGPVLPPAR